jgi:hypothetical protein
LFFSPKPNAINEEEIMMITFNMMMKEHYALK